MGGLSMYEELCARLRRKGKKILDFGSPVFTEVNAKDMVDAADAIELLQTYKVTFENIISMGGWWLVGQDKNLYRMNVPMNWPPKGTKTIEVFPLPQQPEEE